METKTKRKKLQTLKNKACSSFYGGEQGIRTLEQALTCYTISKSSNGYFSCYLAVLIPILENESIIL